MIIVAACARIKDGSAEQGLDHMRRLVAATRAEPGCLEFALSFDVEDGNRLRVFEAYEDAGALATHRASSHMAAWREAFGANVIEASFTEYEVGAKPG